MRSHVPRPSPTARRKINPLLQQSASVFSIASREGSRSTTGVHLQVPPVVVCLHHGICCVSCCTKQRCRHTTYNVLDQKSRTRCTGSGPKSSGAARRNSSSSRSSRFLLSSFCVHHANYCRVSCGAKVVLPAFVTNRK